MVNLALVPLETVLRAGEPSPENLSSAYGEEPDYPGTFGLSVLFHPGWGIDALAQAGHFRHGKVSYATVEQIREALRRARPQYDVLLTPTPMPNQADHHTLAVTDHGTPMRQLVADAALALSSAFLPNLMPNPYRQL